MYVVIMTDIRIGRSWILFLYIKLRYCGTACVYFSFKWGPFVHSLGIVQWNSTRRDHPGNPGGVSGSGPVIYGMVPRWCLGYGTSLVYMVWYIVDFYGKVHYWFLSKT